MSKISKRLLEIINALPLKNDLRILEIGCGTGIAAREIVNRFDTIFVLATDRSEKAIQQSIQNSGAEISAGKLQFQKIAIEEFTLEDHKKFDFAFAIRVGALDGRHPEIEKQALDKIKKSLKSNGKLFIDGGSPLKEIQL